MTNINKSKTQLTLLLIFCTISVHSITFETSHLKDTIDSNYITFSGESKEYSNSFEKVAADFNGDGFDDILSLGGNIQFCTYAKCTPVPPPIPIAMEMMLFQDGEFINHPIDISNFSLFVNIIDIDADGDLDIVMLNGKIAINDGHANFTTIQFSDKELSNQEFFTVDWDQDGDLDIVSKNNIFIQEGILTFTAQSNSTVGEYNFIIANLNSDNSPDLLVHKDSQLQSWISNDQAGLELYSSLNVDGVDASTLLHSIDINGDNAQEFILSYNFEGALKLLNNDGSGILSLSSFEFSEINDLEHKTLTINNIIIKDADNDGDKDLWINTSITTEDIDCQRYQNLTLIYENINDGNLLYKKSLHSIGLRTYSPGLGGHPATSSYPTIIDLNHDNMVDVVMTGENPVAWLNTGNYNFQLSNASSIQLNNHIETADFNGDGNADLLSSGMYNQSCSALTYFPNIHSTTYNAGGELWLGDGKGDFSAYTSSISGLTSFSIASEYSKFVDLNQNGELFLITTIPSNNEFARRTIIEIPLLTDPSIRALLPEPTKLVEAADLTNNGKLELVMLADSDDAPIYILRTPGNGPLPSQIIAELEFGYRDAEIKLVDLDNDGNIDIITNSKQEIGSIKIWYNNGNNTFTPYGAFGDGVKTIAIADFDGDGKQDVLSSNEAHDIWINQGNRGFNKLDYDKSFWYVSDPIRPLELQLVINQVPEKIELEDLNNDGLVDFIAYIENKVHVYMNNSYPGYVSFYKVHNSKIFDYYYADYSFYNPNLSNTVFADFNNDGKMDFASGGQDFIKLNIQKDEQLSTGLYYDRNHSGHGFSIESIGKDNLYYSVFYSYDNEGKPQWFSMLNRYKTSDTENYSELTNINGNDVMRYIYDYNTLSTTLDDSPEYLGRLIFKNDQTNNVLNYASYQIGNEINEWQIGEIIPESLKPDVDLSGIWWAGTDDAGWGISLSFVQRESGQEVVVVLYYYDDQGHPSWLIGQQNGFELNQETIVDMQYIKGYGRNDNYVELTKYDAGTITLNLNQASNELSEAGTLSMDLFYPNDTFVINNWVRENIPIALFSKPRN